MNTMVIAMCTVCVLIRKCAILSEKKKHCNGCYVAFFANGISDRKNVFVKEDVGDIIEIGT